MSIHKTDGYDTREASHSNALFCSSTLISQFHFQPVTSLSLAALVGLLPMNAGSVFLICTRTSYKLRNDTVCKFYNLRTDCNHYVRMIQLIHG